MLDWYDSEQHLTLLYEKDLDLVVTYDYDTTLANAHRLGRDIACLLDAAALSRIRRLLDDQTASERLANDMSGPFERTYPRISAMCAGIRSEAAS
ncbi:hypothetical protein [Nocardia sp. NPDC052566]|uniref:hypothetical protein n=1 Tax=Nocardia sp. NPDC052566 TaxID=3364330 RepID=UPI0037C64D90